MCSIIGAGDWNTAGAGAENSTTRSGRNPGAGEMYSTCAVEHCPGPWALQTSTKPTTTLNWKVHLHQLLHHLGSSTSSKPDPRVPHEQPAAAPQRGVSAAVQLEEKSSGPSRAVRRVLLSLPGPGGCLLVPKNATRGAHLADGVVGNRSQDRRCSCLSHKRSRRSLRRRAIAVPPSALHGPPAWVRPTRIQKKGQRNLFEPVWLWWLWCGRVAYMTCLSMPHSSNASNSGPCPCRHGTQKNPHPES